MGSPTLRFQSQGEGGVWEEAVSKGHWEARRVSSEQPGRETFLAGEGALGVTVAPPLVFSARTPSCSADSGLGGASRAPTSPSLGPSLFPANFCISPGTSTAPALHISAGEKRGLGQLPGTFLLHSSLFRAPVDPGPARETFPEQYQGERGLGPDCVLRVSATPTLGLRASLGAAP